MADLADLADIHIHNVITEALSKRTYKPLRPKGRCHNCAETVAPTLLFCDKDCRDDFERIERNKNQFQF